MRRTPGPFMLYNAKPEAGVSKLAEFMHGFENGK